jgi:hypothetical protein
MGNFLSAIKFRKKKVLPNSKSFPNLKFSFAQITTVGLNSASNFLNLSEYSSGRIYRFESKLFIVLFS